MEVPKWAPLKIIQNCVPTGYVITLTTDVPCHLWLFWTNIQPRTHRKGKITRGLTVPWDTYWCYVSWTLLNQIEPGDTTTHTYGWYGWENSTRRYFRFHGDIAGETSPSDSPIYTLNYPMTGKDFYFQYEATLPLIKAYNMAGIGLVFLDLKTSYPSTLDLWLFREQAYAANVTIRVEDAEVKSPSEIGPYNDQTGHIRGYTAILADEANLYAGQWHYHSCHVSPSNIINRPYPYCITLFKTSYDFMALSHRVAPPRPITWIAQSALPTNRNWLYLWPNYKFDSKLYGVLG